MKQYIVLMSLIALGVYIFEIIAGDGSDSIYSLLGELWQQGMEIRSYNP